MSDTLTLEVTKEDIVAAFDHAKTPKLDRPAYETCLHCAVAVSARRHGVEIEQDDGSGNGGVGYTCINLPGKYNWVAANKSEMAAFVRDFDTVVYNRDGILPAPITLHFKKEMKNRDYYQA